jgi:hypothetical protein
MQKRKSNFILYKFKIFLKNIFILKVNDRLHQTEAAVVTKKSKGNPKKSDSLLNDYAKK